MKIPVFDGHNDTLTHFHALQQPNSELSFFKRNSESHIDFPRAIEGGFAGGFFAIFCSNPQSDGWNPKNESYQHEKGYDIPLPPPIDRDYAADFCDRMITKLYDWQAQSAGKFAIALSADDLETNLSNGVLSALLHFEGVEAISSDLHELDHYYDRGLRSLGPVWSRPNLFGHGVPFAFPKSPDTGPGLTEAGKALVKACDQKGILVDVSHLNEKGFWDIAKISTRPIVATHCGAWEKSNSTRNLTDRQIDALAESDGLIGINFCKNFLREDGSMETETPLTEIVRHLQYLADRVGTRHLAFGSDFDGAQMPTDLPDVTHLPELISALIEGGFSLDEVEAIAYKNWFRTVRASIG